MPRLYQARALPGSRPVASSRTSRASSERWLLSSAIPSFSRAANNVGSVRPACRKSSSACAGRPRFISATPRLFERMAFALAAPWGDPLPGARREHPARADRRQSPNRSRNRLTGLPGSLQFRTFTLVRRSVRPLGQRTSTRIGNLGFAQAKGQDPLALGKIAGAALCHCGLDFIADSDADQCAQTIAV